MTDYNHKEIEKKWQEKWKQEEVFKTPDKVEGKENFYQLVEFIYPSGSAHVGHWYAFAVPDISAKYYRMRGKNVLFPMGFDAFGLPAENAAIKHSTDPAAWTYDNIERTKKQFETMGNSFDWSRSVTTCDPEYYKWNQWLFNRFFEKGVAYKKKTLVNWDPVDQTVLANEQVLADGTAERSGAAVEKKDLEQWMFKITDYADSLLEELDTLDWPEAIKDLQRNWIGRSEGAEIEFLVKDTDKSIRVFTTRPDTIFGATYMVLAPEHPLLGELGYTNTSAVQVYQEETKKKTEIERGAEGKEKTGVQLEGVVAINPANKEEIPIFIADYVLPQYGTGAIMAVPAHDQRDHEFAKKFDLPIKEVVVERVGERHQEGKFRPIAIAIVENEKGEILVQSQERNGVQTFMLPGGGIDEGETAEEAAIRETEEETGYFGFKNVRKVGTLEANYFHVIKQINRRALATCYAMQVDSSSRKEPEFTEFEKETKISDRWVSKEEALKLLSNPARGVTEDVPLFERFLAGIQANAYAGPGVLMNSGEFDGLTSEEAKEKITEFVGGKMTTTYKMRDWIISRQRYWGTPIPIVYDPEGKPHPIPDEHLPWLLPTDVDYKPKGTSPLGSSKELKERTEKIFGKGWTPEIDTMDTFVDSSWYFLRYLDPDNSEEFSAKEKQGQWMPVDLYSGGAEHTTVHLLYSRFFYHVLHDLGLVKDKEPFKRRYNRGLILSTDGRKMSKRWGNIIDPDKEVAQVGADTVKMYLAFMGPYGVPVNYPWDPGGVVGIRRFVERVWGLQAKFTDSSMEALETLLHQTIKKVGEDIKEFKFNTAISQMMIFINAVEKEGQVGKEQFESFLKVLAPFAPHITEELWHILGNESSIHLESWPTYDEAKTQSDTVTYAVQVNGKLRANLEFARGEDQSAVETAARALPNIEKWITGEPKKVVFVPDRLINFVL